MRHNDRVMTQPRQPAFRPLLSYEVNNTSDVLRRSAALRFRREHGISLTEWRTLARIESAQPVTLRDLVETSSIDKAQLSRVVTALTGRGLVARSAHATDARSAQLKLTEAGRKMIKALAASAKDRDRVFRECLTQAEIDQLVSTLGKLKDAAQKLVDAEGQAEFTPRGNSPPRS
ncbi:MAG: MarR family transcriptional regulator [Burkholderiales bacterium]|nr:MAG: MarR family transcriptional regulator [Burkholderiales bacterium]